MLERFVIPKIILNINNIKKYTMGNICIKEQQLSEFETPLNQTNGVTVEISNNLPDKELEDFYTYSDKHNNTIALAYLFSII